MIPSLPACAWLVTNSRGEESLHRQRTPAELYATQCHGVVEPLVRLKDAMAAIDAAKAAMLPLIADRRHP